MKKFVTLITAALFLVAASTMAGPQNPPAKSVPANPGVAPIHSMPYGKSYSEWSMEWWLYAMSLPLDVNPFGYSTDGTINQSGQVWFLGGTFTGANPNREITIPAGTALFFPVMDAECSTIEPPPFYGGNEAELRACAKDFVDDQVAGVYGTLFCRVDGVEIKNVTQYRAVTPLMTVTFPEAIAATNNIFFVPVAADETIQSVGDGVYVFLFPLPAGQHTIEFNGIVYTVNVLKPGIVPPDQKAYGKTYGQWGSAWWQWALGIPADVNPLLDDTGANFASGQSGPVWFLAGSWASPTPVRYATLPQGKALFFPVVNYECSSLETFPWYGGNEAELRDCLQFNSGYSRKWAEIDGMLVNNIEQYYAMSPSVFRLFIPEDGVSGYTPGTGISMAAGHWLMLAPLSVGTHVIRFGAGEDSDTPSWSFAITYILTVK